MFKKFFSALLPSSCALCGTLSGTVVCGSCYCQCKQVNKVRCVQCGIALEGEGHDKKCGRCLKSSPSYDVTLTAVDYAPPIDQLVVALKFQHQLALVSFFARMLQERIKESGEPLPDFFLATPLSEVRLIERGFNQSLEIAKICARHFNIPFYRDVLIRNKHTAAQMSLSMKERYQNVKGVFLVDTRFRHMLEGKHIGVVDDVMTTGATMEEIAYVLKRNGARKITNLVFARTPL